MRFGHIVLSVLSVLLCLVLAAPVFAAVPFYSVAMVPNSQWTSWRLIDNGGTLYGAAGDTPAYSSAGVIHLLDFGSSDTAYGAVTAISRAGHIGSYEYWTRGTDYPNAYGYLTVNGVSKYIGAIGSDGVSLHTFPNSITSDGRVVGSSRTQIVIPGGDPHFPYHSMHAFLYSDGSMRDLGTLGGTHSSAAGINAAGTIVGTSDTAADTRRAFIYEDGRMSELNAFAGGTSQARGINDAGVIIGQGAHQAGGFESAFLYANGIMTDLGWFPGRRASSAVDINESGQIIGYGNDPYGKVRGFLYQEGQLMQLDMLVDPDEQWVIKATYSINDHGVILADACKLNVCGTVILTPVPEPATYAMLLVGLGWLGVCARRRARASRTKLNFN